MQGFNRYIPPDYDPKQTSTLNAHQGKKHALGKRAKDIDKGILIVRFELPYNIWCGTCNAHIGAGVRYNAQKKKVGNYFSTPIYGFRCKCHLCDGWFEIRTDPKNAAYVVHEGARKKDEDWNPEENGGYAIHDTEAPSAADAPADPFAHIEKTIDQQTWVQSKKTRLTELQESADRLSSDPYVVSAALRRKFREEKKVMLEKQGRDDNLKERYGLHDEVDLGVEDVEKSRAIWEAGRERAGLLVGDAATSDGVDSAESSVRAVAGTPRPRHQGRPSGNADLASTLRKTTARKYDPFADALDGFLGTTPVKVRPKAKVRDPKPVIDVESQANVTAVTTAAAGGIGGGLLAGYASD